MVRFPHREGPEADQALCLIFRAHLSLHSYTVPLTSASLFVNQMHKFVYRERRSVHRERQPVHRERRSVHRERQQVHRECQPVHRERRSVHRERQQVHRERRLVHRERRSVYGERQPVYQRLRLYRRSITQNGISVRTRNPSFSYIARALRLSASVCRKGVSPRAWICRTSRRIRRAA